MASNRIKIVGLDPSLSNFGIAQVTLCLDTMTFNVDNLKLVDTCREKDKKTKKVVRQNSEDLERARILHQGITDATEGHAIAIAEVPVGSQSSRAMASYGICIGILAACDIPLIQVTPSEVKMAGFGNKTATKLEMIEWAMGKYPKANWIMRKSAGVMVPTNANEHLADAIGAIEAGIRTDQFKQIVAIYKSMRGLPA